MYVDLFYDLLVHCTQEWDMPFIEHMAFAASR